MPWADKEEKDTIVKKKQLPNKLRNLIRSGIKEAVIFFIFIALLISLDCNQTMGYFEAGTNVNTRFKLYIPSQKDDFSG